MANKETALAVVNNETSTAIYDPKTCLAPMDKAWSKDLYPGDSDSLWRTDGFQMILTCAISPKKLESLNNRVNKKNIPIPDSTIKQQLEPLDTFDYKDSTTGALIQPKDKKDVQRLVLKSENKEIHVDAARYTWLVKNTKPERVLIHDKVSPVYFLRMDLVVAVLMPMYK